MASTTSISTPRSIRNSSQEVATKEKMCIEQEGMMREWIINKLPTDTHAFFEGVVCPWNPIEFLSDQLETA